MPPLPTPQQQAQNLRRGVPMFASYIALYFGIGYGYPWVTGESLIATSFRALGWYDKNAEADEIKAKPNLSRQTSVQKKTD
jgi:hypothetical protein